jgi:hypothetical protein
MPEPAPNTELLPALGRLVRGLSALFWGLPTALLACFYTARAEMLRSYGILPPLLATGLLAYGVWQLGAFQKQERVWRAALDRAQILALINLGLSPFLFWGNKAPTLPFFWVMSIAFTFSALLFLASLNLVLQRLGAMLPDEALRLEIRQFTTLNLNLLLATLIISIAYFCAAHLGARQLQKFPFWLSLIGDVIDRGSIWFLIVLVLLPLAMTMALLWKTKEVILESVFKSEH